MKTRRALATITILLFAGCAHTHTSTRSDANIAQAVVISNRIDDKAVVVEKWLKSN